MEVQAVDPETHLFRRRRNPNYWAPLKFSCEAVEPVDTITTRFNILLAYGGPGFKLTLCPGTRYPLRAPLRFAWPAQEIRTLSYPTGDERATLVVNGTFADGEGHSTAVDGTCSRCSGVKLRNIQVDGARHGRIPSKQGANIEMGGENSDQLVEYVRSYDPRSWSCLHVQEGLLNCNNVTVQNNDIGPCGTDIEDQWADGISFSCRGSVVRNNAVVGATDGAIVIFGAPGTQVYNNTISITNKTLLGGINLVDYDPFSGDYTGVVVYNNTIIGGFSTDAKRPGRLRGAHHSNAIIKIGIAIGPKIWFGDRYGESTSTSGVVIDNTFTGAFSYAIAITSARNFTVSDNRLAGDTAFVGIAGPNCTSKPVPYPFVAGGNLTTSLMLQPEFQTIPDASSLTCVLSPEGGELWPFFNRTDLDLVAREYLDAGGQAPAFFIGIMCSVLMVVWLLRGWMLRRLLDTNRDHHLGGYYQRLD